MPHFRLMYTGNSPKVKRIAIVGPECTGKTDLAQFLADRYQTQWVPEFARNYIETLNRTYNEKDLKLIADGQLALEDERAAIAKDFLFCDTNLIVIKIWSEFKYGSCDPEILEKMHARKYALHLLTDVDLPWEDDPLREHPDKRSELFTLYETELLKNKLPFVKISGDYTARRLAALEAVQKIT
jgi:NadR type nicotinamide-nucleotide adenylyltransferase